MIKIEYKTKEERENAIEEQQTLGYYLIEEQNITEGNFLIFGEQPNPTVKPEPLKPSEIDLLKAQLMTSLDRQEFLEDLIAEMAMMVYD